MPEQDLSVAILAPRAEFFENGLGGHSILPVFILPDVQADENLVAVGGDEHRACRAAGPFVRFGNDGYPVGFELALDDTHIIERRKQLGPTNLD